MEKIFKKSLTLVLEFYLIIGLFFLIWNCLIECFTSVDIRISLLILFIGNLFLAILTQVLHYFRYYKETDDANLDEYKKFAFEYKVDCFVRCSAGLLETIAYTLFFALKLPEITAAYLIFKTLSIWNHDDSKKEGISTAVLRIAIVFSLGFSIFAAYFLNLEFISIAFK